MKKWLAFIACVAIASLNVWAQGEPTTFSLSPVGNRAQAGETFRVELHLTTVQALFKATARVASNNPKVTIKDVEFPAYAGNVTTKKTVISATERIVGAETQFALLFDAGFNGVVATIVFEVANDAQAGDTADLTLSVDKYLTVNVGCYDLATSVKLASSLSNATLTVVKLFNAPALTGAVNEGAGQIVLNPVFTDENGAPKVGDITQLNFVYPGPGDEDNYGKFSISIDSKTILYTAPTIVGNVAPLVLEATYTASSGANVDQNTVTVTVTPVNDPPAVAVVTPIADINEGQPVSFTITVDDEENGAFDYVVYRQDGAQWEVVEGTWAGLTFTSTETPDNDVVVHPNLTKVVNLKVEAVDQFDAQTTESAPGPVTIHDVDRPVGAPTAVAIVPDPAFVTSVLDVTFTPAVDPDPEDVVTYTYRWTNELTRTVVTTKTVPAGAAKKGETWTVVVTANSFNGDSEDSDPAQITISNSLPTVANGTLFIQKGDGLPKTKDIDLSALASDPDGLADVTEMVIVTQPGKGTLTLKAGTVYTYKVTGDEEFFGATADTFTFKAKDASGDQSAAFATVTVTYRTNPPPVFVAGTAAGVDPAGYDEVTIANANAPTVVNVSVQVGDTDNAGGTVPGAGVAQVVWNLELKDAPPLRNGVDPNSWLQYAGAPGIAGENTGIVPCTINFPGFDTIAGPDRPASLTFVLSVVAADGYEGGGSESEPFVFPDIVIRDVDRAPTAPTAISFDPNGDLFTGDTVSALADGFTDPDGDALVGYHYAWTLENAKLTNPGLSPLTAVPALADDGGLAPCAWPFARNLIKGDVLNVTVVAVTAPAYALAARKESPAFAPAPLTVDNTAPEFVTAAGANWELFESATGTEEAVQALAFAWEINTRNGDPILVANDIDAAAFQTAAGADYFVDSLVFSIDPAAAGADYDANVSGPVVIGPDGTSLVYTPKQYYNGAFIVGVKATDESGASATYLLTITVAAVNDQPVADVADIYAVPSDCDGTTVHIKYFAVYPGGDDDSEAEQLLQQANLVADDPNAIIVASAAVVINGFDAAGAITDAAFADADVLNDLDRADALAKLFASTQRAVAVKYVLAEDAPMGEEIPLTLTVQDDGGTRDGLADDTGTADFKIVLGATPWYPIFELPCQEHATHQVKLTAPGQATVFVYVTGGVLKPEHYFYSSTSGLASGVVYTAELRPWNPVQGVAGPVCGVDDPDDLQVEVPEYGLPGQAEVAITGPDAVTGKYIFAIKAPLAGGYVLTITRNGAAFKTITSNFVPNADGLILPNADLALDLFAAGTYVATVHGVNPKGAGEESAPAEVVVGAGNAAQLAWPADGVFVPASGKNIVVPSGTASTTVKFSWPVVSAATAYNFYLYDSYGKVVKTMSELKVNAQSVEIAITANSFGSYTWWVEAVSGGNALASQTLSFRLIEQTDAPLVEKFTIAEGAADKLIMSFSQEQGALPAVGTVVYEVQHYDVSAKRWIMYLKKDGKSVRPVDEGNGTWSLRLPGSTLAAGDYILIREYVNNVVQGNFVLYRISQTMSN